jgi:uroporphyrinogen-III synthase
VVGSAQLRGMTVLIPRSRERGAALAALIEAAGGRAVVAPLTGQVSVTGPDQRALDDALPGAVAGAFDWVVVTSVNAVRAILAAPEVTAALV